MIPIRLLATFLFAVLLLAAATAPATTLSVAPTRLELAPDRPAAAVTVTNDGKAPVLVQVETFAWRASPATADLEPTRELLAVPPLLRLAPGEKQLVRVARRSNTPLQVEETYRLLVSEVPEGGERGGVRLALRLSLPVFVTPPGARAAPRWRLHRDHAGLVLEVRNLGTAHLHVREAQILVHGRVLPVTVAPAYVLAGQTHQWALGELRLEGAHALGLRAETNLGEIELLVPVQGG